MTEKNFEISEKIKAYFFQCLIQHYLQQATCYSLFACFQRRVQKIASIQRSRKSAAFENQQAKNVTTRGFMVAKKSSRDNHETQLGFAKHPAFSLNFFPYSDPILNSPFKTLIFENFFTFYLTYFKRHFFCENDFQKGLFIIGIL